MLGLALSLNGWTKNYTPLLTDFWGCQTGKISQHGTQNEEILYRKLQS